MVHIFRLGCLHLMHLAGFFERPFSSIFERAQRANRSSARAFPCVKADVWALRRLAELSQLLVSATFGHHFSTNRGTQWSNQTASQRKTKINTH